MTLTWENESRAARWWNTERPLTRSLDLGEEGLAMQATRICSVAECDQTHFGLGFCRKHYNKQNYAKRAVPGGRKYPPRTFCEVDSCGRPTKAHKMCGTHYQRFLRTGSATGTIPRQSRGICTVVECGKPHRARGYCEAHWRLWRHNGDAQINRRSWRWLGDSVGYMGAHGRTIRAKGAASDHTCVDCGTTAAEWSYDHRDPNEKTELVGVRTLVYSTKVEHYEARCRSCHGLFDNHARAPRARLRAPYSGQQAPVGHRDTPEPAETITGGGA
jgi:hypothetical protein